MTGFLIENIFDVEPAGPIGAGPFWASLGILAGFIIARCTQRTRAGWHACSDGPALAPWPWRGPKTTKRTGRRADLVTVAGRGTFSGRCGLLRCCAVYTI